jgi:tetratricopeptide (TPR) repeat protein
VSGAEGLTGLSAPAPRGYRRILGTSVVAKGSDSLRPSPYSRLFPLVLVGAILVAYFNSFAGSFVFDDREMIIGDTQVHEPFSHWTAILARTRPLVTFSLALNYALGGLNTWGYHAFNLGIHVMAALTLYGLVRRTLLLEGVDHNYRQTAAALALAVSLLWAVHPLQTESVTYTVQRSESLMGLFYLLTLYCVLRGAVAPKGAARWYAGAVLCSALGMGSKEVMCTAPVVVMLYDRVFLSSSFRELLRKRRALYVGLAATWLILAMPVKTALQSSSQVGAAGPSGGFAIKNLTPLAYACSQPGVVTHYLRLAFWPYPLCLDYDWPVARAAGATLLPGLLILILSLLTVWALRDRPALGFLGACFFIILAPTSTIMPIADLAAERRMYLPLAALIGLLVVGGYWSLTRLVARYQWDAAQVRRLACASVGVVAVALAFSTQRRNQDYFSEAAMWRSVVDVRPANMRARQNLGALLLEAGKTSEAADQFRVLVQHQPDAQAHYLLGSALESLGRAGEAVKHYAAAVRLEPRNAQWHFNLANALASQGDLEEALVHCREVVKLWPDLALGFNNLARILANLGKNEEAVEYYHKALQLAPGLAMAHNNLGIALVRLGKYEEAVEQYRRALAIDPTYVSAYSNWGNALVKQGRFGEAAAIYRKATELDPGLARGHYNLAHALHGEGKTDEAARRYRLALGLDPSWPQLATELAWRLATDAEPARRDGAEALRLAQQACQATEKPEPRMLDVLAASHAAVGRYSDAVTVARQARALAISRAQSDLVRQIEHRIDVYTNHQAFSAKRGKSPSS